jgi:hypothetical protein
VFLCVCAVFVCCVALRVCVCQTALFFVVYEACSRILSEKGLLGQFETDKYAKISKKELTQAKIA